MTWEQLKNRLEEAVARDATASVSTVSPCTVLAIMQQVDDLQALIKDLDKAVLRWMSASDDDKNWPEYLSTLIEVQEKIRELRLS